MYSITYRGVVKSFRSRGQIVSFLRRKTNGYVTDTGRDIVVRLSYYDIFYPVF